MRDPDRHEIQRSKHVREARQALVLLSVLQLAGGVFLFSDQRRPEVERLGSLLFQGILALLLLGLWAWSRRRPRAALVAALAAWGTLLIATIILDTQTALYGGVPAAVITLVLVRGARAALVAARLDATSS
jgi:hypothetical protein